MTDDEIKIYYLLNEVRKNAGLEPLSLDLRLTKSAGKRNENLIKNENAVHSSRDSIFIGYIREVAGKDYHRFGQITLMGKTLEKAAEGFKKYSGKGHYLFNPMFTHMGTAVLSLSPSVILITVHFGAKK